MQAKKPHVFLQPAAGVIAKFNSPNKDDGARRLAALMGLDKSTVCQWRVPKARGGTGGLIPAWHHEDILDLAKRLGIRMGPADLVRRTLRRSYPSSPMSPG